jgi:predicted ATP-grasp superfamily ATP-dependent carboligase
MSRAIAGDFARTPRESVRVFLTRDPRLADEPGPWEIVTIADVDNSRQLESLARSADFTVLIAPETGGVLADLTRTLEGAGARLLGSSPEAVAQATDKAAIARRLLAAGVDTPPTRAFVPAQGLPPDIVYPAVIKPVDGAGSMDTFYLSHAQRMPDLARSIPLAVIQPFVPGSPMSASFLVDQSSRPWLLCCGSQHMKLEDGRFAYHGGTLPIDCAGAREQLEPAVKAIAGLRGFVGVDFLWDEARRHATILEINPRPTTSCVGLCQLLPAGLLASAWLAACGSSGLDASVLEALATSVSEASATIVFQADGDCRRQDRGASRL